MKKNILKLSVLSIVCAALVFDANAASSVKKLGGTTKANVASAATVQKAEGITPARVGSARLNVSNAVKPTAVNAKSAVSGGVTTASPNTSRLSLGKYLHGANITKPSGTPGASSSDFVALQDKVGEIDGRVTVVEGNVETIKGDLETGLEDFKAHMENNDIHVTADEKTVWNGKQDALAAGKGIEIKDGFISSDMKIPVGSENGDRSATIWIE